MLRPLSPSRKRSVDNGTHAAARGRGNLIAAAQSTEPGRRMGHTGSELIVMQKFMDP